MAGNTTFYRVLKDEGSLLVVEIAMRSDGTAETGLVKVNKSDFSLGPGGAEPDVLNLVELQYLLFGMNNLVLKWDRNTDDEIVTLFPGGGIIDFPMLVNGEKTDPESAGGTGDIEATTDGVMDGGGYWALLTLMKR